jgi:3-oxoacyl-[acyl-carrier-protein] synthase-3
MSTKFIDLKDPKMLGLFGDAGTAVAIDYQKKIENTTFFSFGTDGEGFKNLIYDSDGMNKLKKNKHLEMNGAKIFEFALKEIPEQIKKILKKSKNKFTSIDYFVFHQANKFLLETLMKKMKIPNKKVLYSIDDYGNTNSASIPITMFKNLKNKKNIKVLVCGFGVGYSWSSAIINLGNINYPTLNKL